MPQVRFLGFAHTAYYRGSRVGTEDDWARLEVRDVPEETALYLSLAFPLAFERVQAATAAPENRMTASPVAKAAFRRK